MAYINGNNVTLNADIDTYNSDVNLSDYVLKTLKIAGIALADDITATELRNAMNTYPVIFYNGAPSTATVGRTGQLYFDEINKNLYICLGRNNSSYNWFNLTGKIDDQASFVGSYSAATPQSEVVGQIEYVGSGLAGQKGLHILIDETGERLQLATMEDVKNNTRFNTRNKIYGVTFDDRTTDTAVTRIADAKGLQNDYVIGAEFQNGGRNDFDNVFPWCDMRRCNLTVGSDGVKKIVYEGEEGFTTKPIGCNNLFNPENVVNANIDTTNYKIVSSPSCRLGYIECEPNTTYTIIRNGTLGSRFTYGYTTEFPVAETAVKNMFVKPTSPTVTYTTGDGARYLVFYFYIEKYDTDIEPNELAKNIMVAKGTATEFEAFIENFAATTANVMVEIPKFYTSREKINGVETWAITGEPKSGFNIEPAFIDSNGKELDFIYVGAYEFSGTSATTNHSVSGQEVATTLTMANYRNIAKAVNMSCIDYAIIHALQFLWVVEFADRDTDKYMQGFSYAPWYSSGNSAITNISADRMTVTIGYTGTRVKSLKAGQNVIICQATQAKQTNLTITSVAVSADETTADITFDKAIIEDLAEITDGTYYVAGKAQTTGRSDAISYHTGRINGENALSPFRYRYMENLWGNTWAMLEGIRIKELNYYYTFDINHYADTNIDDWEKSNFKAPFQPYLGDDGKNRAWVSAMGFDVNNRQIVLPVACSTDGATNKYYSAAFYSNYDVDMQGNELDKTQEYICVYGGGYDHNVLCGLFTMRFFWHIGSGEQQALHSSRIVYRY